LERLDVTPSDGTPEAEYRRAHAQYTATPESEYVRGRVKALRDGGTIVIHDLEYTSWEGSLARRWSGEGEYRELVQIGAVKLEWTQGLPEIDSFERFSLPEFNPVLSDYFTGLTGITNADLDREGRPFARVIAEFADFVGDSPVVAANGDDARCLVENCGWRGVEMPIAEERTLNLRPLFMAHLNLPRAATVSSELPGLLGLSMEGTAHTGLADARAIALALRVMWRDGLLD
jgi:inhibitor of KinA sporulation pathway (predicted exonuclease)